MKEYRLYRFEGNKEDLDTLEKIFRHIEYLGEVGASRNILIRVDGDGTGRIQVYREDTTKIDTDKYNIEQNLGQGAIVGIYDIG